jgi:hypothetical protein
MPRHLAQPLRHFLRRTDGVGTVEVVFSVIVLNMMLMGFYLWWGAFNAHALVDRMTYTVSDLVTRQRGVELNRSLLDGLDRTAEFILDPEQDAAVRFTQVSMVAGATEGDPPTLVVDWSYSPCNALPAAVVEPGFDAASLPLMAPGSSLIVTDVQVPFTSDFELIPSMTLERRAAALYRFENSFALVGQGAATCPG